MTSEQLAKWRIRMGWMGGLAFLFLAQPRLRWIFGLGFLLAVAGEGLRIWAAGTIKKNKALATDGPYSVVRHPLYLGSFLIAAGFALASFNPWHPFRTALVWALAFGGFAWVYRRKMADEESKIHELFGADFERWRERTPMFWPALKKGAVRPAPFDAALALKHREHHTIAGMLAIAAFLWMKLVYQL